MTETNNQYNYKKQSYKKLMFIIIGLIICAVSFVTDIIVGPASLTLSDVWLALTDPSEVSKNAYVIIWSIRLPTAIMALLVGASLGIAGAGMQTILDNPLSSPYTLGISAGQYMASPEALQNIVFWTMGSLAKANWINISIVLLVLVIMLPLMMRESWRLTALKLGDEKASGLGVDVESLRVKVFAFISIITAVAVSFVGTIGFIGIVGPHIARMLVGEDQRYFLPLSAVCGMAILSLASIASKMLVPGAMFPIGIVTAIIGVPFFFSLVLTRKRSYFK